MKAIGKLITVSKCETNTNELIQKTLQEIQVQNESTKFLEGKNPFFIFDYDFMNGTFYRIQFHSDRLIILEIINDQLTNVYNIKNEGGFEVEDIS